MIRLTEKGNSTLIPTVVRCRPLSSAGDQLILMLLILLVRIIDYKYWVAVGRDLYQILTFHVTIFLVVGGGLSWLEEVLLSL
jgi:hypothetical protein